MWCEATRPGGTHDVTTIRIEGADVLLDTYPDVHLLVDAGWAARRMDVLVLPTTAGP